MIIEIIIIVISLFAIWFGASAFFANKKIKKWPTASAHIFEKTVKYEDEKAIAKEPPAARYHPVIRYSYQVGGKRFTSNAIYPGGVRYYDFKKNIEKFLQKLPDNTQVYYNSKNLSESYLLLHSEIWPVLALVLGLIFFISEIIYGITTRFAL